MECTNCCEEIEEGKEVYDGEGNPFCGWEHMEMYHEDD